MTASTKPEGYVFGRPREWDRAKIAEELVAWSCLDSSINLCEFCAKKLLQATKITDWAREDENFRAAYNIAKHNIGARREVKLSKGLLHQKAYDLNAKTYDYFLKEESKEQSAYESSLRKSEEVSKQTHYTIMVPNELSAGTPVQATVIPTAHNSVAK